MSSKHLSDYDIQQLVLDKSTCEQSIIQHALACKRCSGKVETYRLIFASLEVQPKPFFEFDVTALVLSKLAGKEEKQLSSKKLAYLTVTITMAPLATVSYLFGEHLLELLSSVSTISLYLVGSTTSTFLVFQIIEMIRRHKKQMADLHPGGTMRHS